MNLKNKYLLKKLLKWANKKQNNYNINNVAFFKRKGKTAGDIIILHRCRKNLDDMIYSSWDTQPGRLKLIILGHFWPFYPPNNPKNQNFEKKKKLLEISFYTCTENHNHMKYSSWDTEWERQNFLSFWTVFCPFTP